MKATIFLHPKVQIGAVDKRLYGGFIEHLGRAIYEGIYEPEHETADEQGFRRDVIELVKALGMPITRYPGGNFVSNYRWEDGVGPVEERPVRLDIAWKALEPNTVGTNEFVDWCKKANTEVMMAVNLGTRGAAEAQALLEYCNHPGGTYYSDLRRTHGWEKPHDIKLWCLGNEMDGSWQMGHKSAEEYGKLARETAKLMKGIDPSIELIVCGSSSSSMPTFAAYEATVLEHTIDLVDYISVHSYYGNPGNESAGYLAKNDDMDRFIKKVVATVDYVAAKKKIDKKIMLSFDEWNVWFHQSPSDTDSPEWRVPRALLEDVYTMEDALLVGGMLITLLNNADRVKIACIAQTVNVIGPIMTRKGGGVWKQTIFHPFAYASKYGRGIALKSIVDCPTYDATFEGKEIKNIPTLSCAASLNENELVLFVLNRNLHNDTELEVDLSGFKAGEIIEWVELRNDDLKAVNTEYEETVKPVRKSSARLKDQTLSASLGPASWNMLRISLTSVRT